MTIDNAIAVLRRIQEPDPFEPQITQAAFDALEMAIDMIERYSTWSQTYSNIVEDAISRKAAIDVIHKYFAERIEQSLTHMTEDGEVYDLGICNPLLADNKALSQAIKELPSAQSDLIATIQIGIKATDADDVYSCGMRNGMRWCKSLIDDKEPLYENCPSAQPEIIRCKDCKWSDWYTALDGNRYCYCMETGNGGRTEDDYCSYAERETDA